MVHVVQVRGGDREQTKNHRAFDQCHAEQRARPRVVCDLLKLFEKAGGLVPVLRDGL